MKSPFKRKPGPGSKAANNNSLHPVRESLPGYRLAFRIALAALLIFGITFLYPVDKIYQPVAIPNAGEIASRDIVAPFDFPIMKSEDELRKDREAVLAHLRPVITYDSLETETVRRRVGRFFDLVDSLNSLDLESSKFDQALKVHYSMFQDTAVGLLRDALSSRALRELCIRVTDSLMQAGVYSSLSSLPLDESDRVILEKNGQDFNVSREQIFDMDKAHWFVSMKIETGLSRFPRLKPLANDVIWEFLEPNLRFNSEATERHKEAELAAINPDKGWVYKDQKIVRANERVTRLERDKLLSLAHYKRTKLLRSDFWQFLLPPLGRLFFVAFPILFFGFYLFYFRRSIFSSNSALILFSILLAGLVVILDLVMSQASWSPYLVPITIASMLATIAFDLETGQFLTFAAAILTGVLAGFRLDIAFVGIVAGTVATFSVRRVRHRHEFYRSIFYLTVVYFGVVYIIESLKLTPVNDLWRHVGFAVINGFLSPILTIGILPFVETAFGVTTDITLLELSDLNRPLLKRLAIEAPGTYHHSIMIGALAEDAAKAINANSLLARVGSYYHDIGKMLKPEYFVENQMGARNKHEKLAPSMSALILESHVKEGKELAEKNGLPECIIEFITGHHGTTVMTYFYEKARDLEGDGVEVNEYRYPGPKPKTKEVAIVMLADSVEAASRTLEDPKPARVKNQVHKIISAKFESGELEDCDLTLQELHQIEESFVRVLTGIFHRRITYPEKEEELGVGV
jgi:putative nucleotidyltransferase with HDIG domain